MQNSKDVASQAIPKAYRVFTLTSIMTISMGNAKKTLFAHTLARFSNYGGGMSQVITMLQKLLRNLWTN